MLKKLHAYKNKQTNETLPNKRPPQNPEKKI